MATTTKAVTPPANDAEAEAMRQAVLEYDRQRLEADYEERTARFAPLREFVDSDAFSTVRDTAAELAPDFAADDAINVHLQHLAPFMDRLRAALETRTARPVQLAQAEAAAPAAEPA